MTIADIILACSLFFIIASLYSSVGHAGSSGYLALMALLSFAPETIKPTSIDDRNAGFVTGITVPVDGGFLSCPGV
jgi:hypothetical protein